MYGKDCIFENNTSFKALSPKPILHPATMYFSEDYF